MTPAWDELARERGRVATNEGRVSWALAALIVVVVSGWSITFGTGWAEARVQQGTSPNGGDLFDCSDFGSVDEAQEELLDGDPYGLDGDSNGIACDEAGGTTAHRGEKISVTGVVEYQGEKADGTPVWGLSVSPEVGFYLEGREDLASFRGRTVTVRGKERLDSEAAVLDVRSIEDAQTRDEDPPEGAANAGGGREAGESSASRLLPASGGGLAIAVVAGAILLGAAALMRASRR